MSGLKEVVLYIGSVYCFLHVDCWERVLFGVFYVFMLYFTGKKVV